MNYERALEFKIRFSAPISEKEYAHYYYRTANDWKPTLILVLLLVLII